MTSSTWRRSSPRQHDVARAAATQAEWCSNHHVVFSHGNTTLPKARRTYFDGLPQLRVREGAYSDVPLYRPQVDIDPGAYQLRLNWQFTNYPLARSPRERLSQRATPFYQCDSIAAAAGSSASPRQAAATAESSPTASSGAGYPQEPPRQEGRRVSQEGQRVRRSVGRKLQVKRTSMADVPTAAEYGRFVDWCRAEHGHMVSVWWKLDDDKSMTLSKVEFLKGLSKLQYRGDVKMLWANLDRDHDNMVSFIEFVPECALDLAQFKRWAEQRYGSLTGAFVVFDVDRSGKLTLGEFQKACDKEGIPSHLKGGEIALFQLLGGWDPRTGITTLSKTDLAPFEAWTFPEYLWGDPDFDGLEEFRSHLCARYTGNPIIAWRKALDRNSDMKLSYAEFRKSYELHHSSKEAGDANKVYCALDTCRSGWISLRDWDKASHDLLAEFASWAKSMFGRPSRCIRAWQDPSSESVGIDAFIKGIEPLGYDLGKADLLFGGLSIEGVVRARNSMLPGKQSRFKKVGTITQAKLAFLDQWDAEAHVLEREAWQRMYERKMPKSEEAPAAEVS